MWKPIAKLYIVDNQRQRRRSKLKRYNDSASRVQSQVYLNYAEAQPIFDEVSFSRLAFPMGLSRLIE